jgi:alcohol dehydrogenase class IV
MEHLPTLLKDPKNIEARQATLLSAHYGGNAINTQLAGYVHAFAHSIGALYHIPHGKAIAWCLIPVVEAQENLRYDALKALAVYCGITHEAEEKEAAADRMILALRRLLVQCGLENGCDLLKQEDYDKLVGMIDADSINYSPPRTFSDSEIRMILDQIRRGY